MGSLVVRRFDKYKKTMKWILIFVLVIGFCFVRYRKGIKDFFLFLQNSVNISKECQFSLEQWKQCFVKEMCNYYKENPDLEKSSFKVDEEHKEIEKICKKKFDYELVCKKEGYIKTYLTMFSVLKNNEFVCED